MKRKSERRANTPKKEKRCHVWNWIRLREGCEGRGYNHKELLFHSLVLVCQCFIPPCFQAVTHLSPLLFHSLSGQEVELDSYKTEVATHMADA